MAEEKVVRHCIKKYRYCNDNIKCHLTSSIESIEIHDYIALYENCPQAICE